MAPKVVLQALKLRLPIVRLSVRGEEHIQACARVVLLMKRQDLFEHASEIRTTTHGHALDLLDGIGRCGVDNARQCARKEHNVENPLGHVGFLNSLCSRYGSCSLRLVMRAHRPGDV